MNVVDDPVDVLRRAHKSADGAEGDRQDREAQAEREQQASWQPVDLRPLLSGEQGPDAPTVLQVGDFCLFYRSRLNLVMGESESLKTWLVLVAAARLLQAGEHVYYLDYEDCPSGIVGRLLALGVAPEAIAAYFHYFDSPPKLTDLARIFLEETVARLGPPALVALDGSTEAIAASGLDPDRGVDVAVFYGGTPRYFADHGAAVVMVDHVTKDREGRGRWAIGSERKISGLDGAAYMVDLIAAFGHERTGRAKVLVSKDRQGFVRRHEGPGRLIATLELRSSADGSVSYSLEPPAPSREEPAGFRPTGLMERLSRAIEASPGLSKNALRAAVTGKAATVDLALELLIAGGYVRTEAGPRGARRHLSARPYREDDDGREGENDAAF